MKTTSTKNQKCRRPQKNEKMKTTSKKIKNKDDLKKNNEGNLKERRKKMKTTSKINLKK